MRTFLATEFAKAAEIEVKEARRILINLTKRRWLLGYTLYQFETSHEDGLVVFAFPPDQEGE